MERLAIITGVGGQDGAYLANLLLNKGYKIYGTYRRTSSLNLWRLEELGILESIELLSLELLEKSNIERVIKLIKPDEIYNLAAQSFVADQTALLAHLLFEKTILIKRRNHRVYLSYRKKRLRELDEVL